MSVVGIKFTNNKSLKKKIFKKKYVICDFSSLFMEKGIVLANSLQDLECMCVWKKRDRKKINTQNLKENTLKERESYYFEKKSKIFIV